MWLDKAGEPIKVDMDAVDRQMAVSRRSQALLAAAGEAEPLRSWFVLRVAPAREFAVDNALANGSIERWLPVLDVQPKRRGMRRHQDMRPKSVPVWPGYLFVRTANTARAWAGLAMVKGVLSVLGTAERPVSVPDDKLLELKMKLAHDPDARDIVAQRVRKGQRVRVKDGPFASFEGLVLWLGGFDRVKVDVEIFGRSVPVELELDQIAKIA